MAKKQNEYALAISNRVYFNTPKAVFAAIAVSFLKNHLEIEDGQIDAELLKEWKALYDNEIVPQKPPAIDLKQEPRKAYFLMDTERHEDGQLRPCIAVEGTPGYYRTDWHYGTDWHVAQAIINRLNEKIGVSLTDAVLIQASTMKKVNNDD